MGDKNYISSVLVYHFQTVMAGTNESLMASKHQITAFESLVKVKRKSSIL